MPCRTLTSRPAPCLALPLKTNHVFFLFFFLVWGWGWFYFAGCFVCGLNNGFRVFNAEPLKEKQSRIFADGGIGHAEMLFRCNYLALIGGGRPPKYPTNKVMIWDDRKSKCVIELPFKSEVKAVRLRRDRIVAVLETRVIVFTFTQSPQQLHVYKTTDNPKGLCVLSPEPSEASNSCKLLVFPGPEVGQVQIVDLAEPKKSASILAAHETSLNCIALNNDGTRLATASKKGTLIRVFDTHSNKKLHELRRGSNKASITCISFSRDSKLVCVSSDTKTVHIFNLEHQEDAGSIGSAAKRLLLPSIASSQWSFAKFSVTSPDSICSFTLEGDAVFAACKDGSFYRCAFTLAGETNVTRNNFLSLPAVPLESNSGGSSGLPT